MDVFKYEDYKAFLKKVIKNESKTSRGIQKRLADSTGCQSAYISQVLNNDAQLSLEQAYLVAVFFNLNESQTEYFLILVHIARASNYKYKDYYELKRQQLYKMQLNLKNKLQVKDEFTKEEQHIYYSSWHYLAVHALVSIKVDDTSEISKRLNIPVKKTQIIIDFLIKAGWIVEKDDRLELTKKTFHLGTDSSMLNKHHTNWKLKAIESLDDNKLEDLHYTSLISINKKNIPKFRSIMVETIERLRDITSLSADEDCICCYCLDFFGIAQ